jgi:hypothetical protein
LLGARFVIDGEEEVVIVEVVVAAVVEEGVVAGDAFGDTACIANATAGEVASTIATNAFEETLDSSEIAEPDAQPKMSYSLNWGK